MEGVVYHGPDSSAECVRGDHIRVGILRGMGLTHLDCVGTASVFASLHQAREGPQCERPL